MKRKLLAWFLWQSPARHWRPTIMIRNPGYYYEHYGELKLKIWLRLWGIWMKTTRGERYANHD